MKKDVCIIVPYRDREEHLSKFAPHVSKVLSDENLSYEILVVEQVPGKPFNRAKLLNVGFHYKKDAFKNYVFHDVDMLPIENKASYVAVETPTHYAAIVEQFGWNLAYPEYVGGVTSFDQESFEKINGFCNEYWGWGAEDDDLYRRCKINDVKFMRRHNMYSSLNHERVILKDEYTRNLSVLQEWEKWKNDGLTTLKYNIKETLENPLYLKIVVDI